MTAVADLTSAEEFITTNFKQVGKSGDELSVACPFLSCKGKERAVLYINKTNGKWCCHRCGAAGNSASNLAEKMGLPALAKNGKPILKDEPTGYTLVTKERVEAMEKALSENKAAMLYLTKDRCLKPETIAHFRLGYARLFHAEMGKEADAISIPYFEKSGDCVGIKYRFFGIPKAMNKAQKEKGSKNQLFNLQNIDLKQKVVITEGEIDAISAYQLGYRNVGSVPNGCNGVSGWPQDLAGAKEFYICMDRDEEGQNSVEKVADALGRVRCKRVNLPAKDINEFLVSGLPVEILHKRFETAQDMFTPPPTQLSLYLQDTINEVSGKGPAVGVTSGIVQLDQLMGGIRMGEVTLFTGGTMHGKSTFGLSLIGNLLRTSHFRFLVICGEDRATKIIRRLTCKDIGRNHVTPEDVRGFCNRYHDRLFILNANTWQSEDQQLDLNTLHSTVQYFIEKHGVNYVFIDHAHLFIREGDDDIKSIRQLMNKLRKLVMLNPVHVAMVVQPTKIGVADRKVMMKHLRGSVIWEQSAWNVITVHREDEGGHLVEIEVEKCRETGAKGIFHLRFDAASQINYYEE